MNKIEGALVVRRRRGYNDNFFSLLGYYLGCESLNRRNVLSYIADIIHRHGLEDVPAIYGSDEEWTAWREKRMADRGFPTCIIAEVLVLRKILVSGACDGNGGKGDKNV